MKKILARERSFQGQIPLEMRKTYYSVSPIPCHDTCAYIQRLLVRRWHSDTALTDLFMYLLGSFGYHNVTNVSSRREKVVKETLAKWV